MAPRILCIESDPRERARIRRVLEGEGFAVDEADSGLAGIRRALTLPPDLVVADVRLPDIDGVEIASRLKQERALAAVPFLALGDAPDEHDVAIAAGADAYFSRSAPDAELASEVQAVLAGLREQLPEEGERKGLRALSASMSSHLEHALAEAAEWETKFHDRDRLGHIFIGNLAHELRTALTPITGYLKILSSDKIGALNPQQRRIVDVVQGSTSRISRLVENLSDFSSLQSADAVLFPDEVDADALAEEVVADMRAAIKDARLHVTVQKSGGAKLRADPKKLRQAVANVVGNAVKFSPHGGEVLVEVQRDGDRIRIAVSDQGPGVLPPDQRNIFEPFFHAAGRAEGARHPGSGIGLPVARRIVEAHGGSIWVESPPRAQSEGVRRQFTGSKFVLEIPVPQDG